MNKYYSNKFDLNKIKNIILLNFTICLFLITNNNLFAMQEEEPKEKERISARGEVFLTEEDAASAAEKPTSEEIEEIERNVGTLDILLNDNLKAIAEFLSLEDLCNLSRTSKYFKALCYNNGISRVFLTIFLREQQYPLHFLIEHNKLSALEQLLSYIKRDFPFPVNVNINQSKFIIGTPLAMTQRQHPDAFHETKTGQLLIELGAYITIAPTQEEKHLPKIDALESIKRRILTIQEQFPNNGIIVNLSYFNLKEIPARFFLNLENIIKLDLSGNQLTELPIEIRHLTNLYNLDLSGNLLTPETIQYICLLNNLQTLKLGNHRHQPIELPAEIRNLANLQILDLSGSQPSIEGIQHICQLTNLQVLKLCNNQLTELPIEIRHLINLQTLDLSWNQLNQEAIRNICLLPNLQTLRLSSNQLTELPAVIAELKKLQTFSLYNNRLTQVSIQHISQLTNLQTLRLSANHLTRLPAEIRNFTKLQTFDLSQNQLTQAAIQNICQLTNLQNLDLENNQLIDLPTEIANLTNLQKLYLSQNQLAQEAIRLVEQLRIRGIKIYI